MQKNYIYPITAISNPSIIPATTKRGTIIRRKTLSEIFTSFLNPIFLNLLLNKNIPNFNPNPMLIKTAGISKIPCGNNFHKTKIPPLEILLFITNPKT